MHDHLEKLAEKPKPMQDRTLAIIAAVRESISKEILSVKDEKYRAEQLAELAELYEKYSGEDQVVSSEKIAEILRNRVPEKKVFSGFKGLDDLLDGFRAKQLVVIAAPTKNGKTLFAMELTTRMKAENPLWFPFEEPAEELVQKNIERGLPIPHFFVPQRMMGDTLLWIEKKIVEAKSKYDCKMVFIDHLHFIVPFSMERQDLRIGETMRELKRMAKLWDVTIFIIAHLKKTKMTTNPDLEDLRDSSFIAQEADTVIMLWRKTEKVAGVTVISNDTLVSVQANRRTGKTGTIQLTYRDGRLVETEYAPQTNDDDF